MTTGQGTHKINIINAFIFMAIFNNDPPLFKLMTSLKQEMSHQRNGVCKQTAGCGEVTERVNMATSQARPPPPIHHLTRYK